MQTYSRYKPTEYDTAGLNLPDQQDWLVVPCGQNRDSDALDRCNFEAAVKLLGGESETVEVHRFGHWACGWFEIILVQPDTDAARIAMEIEKRLRDYPVLDEDKLSEMEVEGACQAWKSTDKRERIRICADHGVSIFAARRNEIPQGLRHYEDFYRGE